MLQLHDMHDCKRGVMSIDTASPGPCRKLTWILITPCNLTHPMSAWINRQRQGLQSTLTLFVHKLEPSRLQWYWFDFPASVQGRRHAAILEGSRQGMANSQMHQWQCPPAQQVAGVRCQFRGQWRPCLRLRMPP